jgi:phage-related protein (TIGR01555 family)
MDSYVNHLARLGDGQDNLPSAGTYSVTRRTQDYNLMNALYRNDWIARRIVDTIAEDMCKNWYRITSTLDPDAISQYAKVERRTNLKQSVITGLKWGRLYGGAAGLIMISGQGDMLDQPIDYSMIMPGDFKGVSIFDRWNGVAPSTRLVEDLDDPDFGTPECYMFQTGTLGAGAAIPVHHSRVLRFIGRELPYVERLIEMYWGMSELEHVYDELTKRNMTSANVAQLVFQANLRILKMADFGEMLATTSPRMQEQLYSTIRAQTELMNSHGVQVLDRQDEFQTHQYSFSGLSDVYEQFMMDIAGAAEMPVTKLFGRSPAGMNTTGDSDLRNYYDAIKQKQEAVLRPVIDKLVPIVCTSAWGYAPEDLEYEFQSVREVPEEEQSAVTQRTAQAILQAFQLGAISQKTTLKELRATSSMTGLWSTITDEDIDNADDLTPLAALEREAAVEEPPPGNLVKEGGLLPGVAADA